MHDLAEIKVFRIRTNCVAVWEGEATPFPRRFPTTARALSDSIPRIDCRTLAVLPPRSGLTDERPRCMGCGALLADQLQQAIGLPPSHGRMPPEKTSTTGLARRKPLAGQSFAAARPRRDVRSVG